MKKLIILISIAALMATPVTAQRNKAKAKAKAKTTKTVKAEPTPGEKLFRQMLDATAKVMFIDSVVVDKADFLAHLPLPAEAGTVAIANPKDDARNHVAMFQNDFADRRIIAKGDSTASSLYTQILLGGQEVNGRWTEGQWSQPTPMPGLQNDNANNANNNSDDDDDDDDGATIALSLLNYPFLASDGVTLYFSAQSDNALGGRDIFMTTYDNDEGEWYRPQNCGLPFSSTDNDYLLAIDDYDTLAWLVTDRRQPEGKVCIYTFVPTATRTNFDGDTPQPLLESYARIMSISDTWRFGDRNAALRRRDAMINRIKTYSANPNNNTSNTRNNTSNIHNNTSSTSSSSQQRELEQMIADTTASLDSMRQQWHQGNNSASLRQQILKEERNLERQINDLKTLKKKSVQ